MKPTAYDSFSPGDESICAQFNKPTGITVDEEGNVYVTDMMNSRIQKFTCDGRFLAKFGERGTLPGQFQYPSASAVANGKIYVADTNNHRIQVFSELDRIPKNKAVIVAGGGPYDGNTLWNATQVCANTAYWSLIYQGYSKEDIYFLTSSENLDLDGNGKADDVYGDATFDNLMKAMDACGETGDNDLLMYLVDHGAKEEFRLSGSKHLKDWELNLKLGEVSGPMNGDAYVIIEACRSGSFIPAMASTGGKAPIVITSASAQEDAHFLAQGTISFSDFFWTNVFNGFGIGDAFNEASAAIGNITDLQHPQMDSDGDGIPNTDGDFDLTGDLKIGSGTETILNIPRIDVIYIENIDREGSSADIRAMVSNNDNIVRVSAQIVPPGYLGNPSGRPVTGLPEIDLEHLGDGEYGGTFTKFDINGEYRIMVYAQDNKGNTSRPVSKPLRFEASTRKAIILAGDCGPDSLPCPLRDRNVDLAYDALRFQLYSEADIRVIGNLLNVSMEIDVLPPSLQRIDDTVSNWASQDTRDLMIYLHGIGEKGALKFREFDLSANELKDMLDHLGERMSGTVTIINDGDYSGGFIPFLASANRIIITSADADRKACFLTDKNVSFSEYFWKQILNGEPIGFAFDRAENYLGFSENVLCEPTIPQLIDPDHLSENYLIGAGIRRAALDQKDESVSFDIGLNGETSLSLEFKSKLLEQTYGITAKITPPDYTYRSLFEPLPSLPKVELDNKGEGLFQAMYSGFSDFGVYTVDFHSPVKNTPISTTRVFQQSGKDTYEPDDSSEQAGNITVDFEKPQHRNFHTETDEDWIKFYGLSGITYRVIISGRGEDCKPTVEFYPESGLTSTPIKTFKNEEIQNWPCREEGVYYIGITNKNSPSEGDTGYYLRITLDRGPVAGIIVGHVRELDSEAPIGTARIKSDSGYSTLTYENGAFVLAHPPETQLKITADAASFAPGTIMATLNEGQTESLDFRLTRDSGNVIPVSPDNTVDGPLDCCSDKEVDKGGICFIGTVR